MSHIRPARPLVDVLEDEWDRQLFRGPGALANQLGWSSYHVLRSKGSRAGYPDRTLVRERIVFVELKRETTGPTAEQIEWLDKLAAAGGETYLWRPSDLEDVARILSGRWEPAYRHATHPDALWTPRDGHWTPGSLWIPGKGRHDTTVNEQQTLGVA